MNTALEHATLMRTHVCAQCWGVLVERYIDGTFTVVCPKGCQPGGFVTKEYAERRKSQSLADMYDVLHNLPQFAQASPVKDETLWGKDTF